MTATTKNDLYAELGNELTNDDLGESRGTLQRVRAGYDFCEFETASGETVRREVDEVLAALDNGFTF
jgi:hypothetical protein